MTKMTKALHIPMLLTLISGCAEVPYSEGAINPNDPSGGGRWVTTREIGASPGFPDGSLIQIDKTSIHKEGHYTTYWSRTWDVAQKRPLIVFGQETIFERAFDCENMRAAVSPVKSHFFSGGVPLTNATWKDIDRGPDYDLVCGTDINMIALKRYQRVVGPTN